MEAVKEVNHRGLTIKVYFDGHEFYEFRIFTGKGKWIASGLCNATIEDAVSRAVAWLDEKWTEVQELVE